MHSISLKQFQGPLDLLLQLIEDKKLNITEISLAKVTDQYLVHLKNLEKISLDNLANFLLLASRLILIKSRMLLPSLELTQDDEDDIEAFKRQLTEYKKFQDLAQKLREIAALENVAYSREKYQGIKSFFYPPQNIALEDLNKAFKKLLDEAVALENKLAEKSFASKISIEDKIKLIYEKLATKIKTTFQEITQKTKPGLGTIVSFLALLELIKQEIVQTEQNELYGEIIISKQAILENGYIETRN